MLSIKHIKLKTAFIFKFSKRFVWSLHVTQRIELVVRELDFLQKWKIYPIVQTKLPKFSGRLHGLLQWNQLCIKWSWRMIGRMVWRIYSYGAREHLAVGR